MTKKQLKQLFLDTLFKLAVGSAIVTVLLLAVICVCLFVALLVTVCGWYLPLYLICTFAIGHYAYKPFKDFLND